MPVIQFHFNWKQLSMIAGVSFSNAYFRPHEGSIKSAQIVKFLKALLKQIGQRLPIVWDGLEAHPPRLVRDYVDSLDGKIKLAFLPPYAPKFNPPEYLWAWLKRHALAKYCPHSIADLADTARGKLKCGKLKSASGAPRLSPRPGNRLICSDVTKFRSSQQLPFRFARWHSATLLQWRVTRCPASYSGPCLRLPDSPTPCYVKATTDCS